MVESGIEDGINRDNKKIHKSCPSCKSFLTKIIESNSVNHLCLNNDCKQIMF